MANSKEELKLIRMNEVEATEIDWLWNPYIPFGKITVIQGDPGDGKTTVVLVIAAAVTTGRTGGEDEKEGISLRVQTQTRRQRRQAPHAGGRENAGANCRR